MLDFYKFKEDEREESDTNFEIFEPEFLVTTYGEIAGAFANFSEDKQVEDWVDEHFNEPDTMLKVLADAYTRDAQVLKEYPEGVAYAKKAIDIFLRKGGNIEYLRLKLAQKETALNAQEKENGQFKAGSAEADVKEETKDLQAVAESLHSPYDSIFELAEEIDRLIKERDKFADKQDWSSYDVLDGVINEKDDQLRELCKTVDPYMLKEIAQNRKLFEDEMNKQSRAASGSTVQLATKSARHLAAARIEMMASQAVKRMEAQQD